ncbi:hypothetical protein RA210_U70198 [Rubrivivax sp. A210]|uniref:hypothetical protein n=1 Tax=Rubrivivax sp. A210 TaxID=2772301 RepID=UPI0019184C6F|nr:hypothetical protein [Rubrivivax sp. A210]CAD5374882.1 hypothetical protein RA210_U70198 [Rubrivivax sp. A210]
MSRQRQANDWSDTLPARMDTLSHQDTTGGDAGPSRARTRVVPSILLLLLALMLVKLSKVSG